MLFRSIVVPLGIIAGLSPILVMVIAFVGNMLTIVPLVIAFEKFQIWYEKRKKKKKNNHGDKIVRGRKLWNKYGLPGLSLMGPFIIGTHIAVIIGMSLGANKYWTTIWMTISIGLWCIVFGLGTMYGLEWLTVGN